MTWPAVAAYGSWPAFRPEPPAPAAAVTTWPERAPAWSATWPAPPALAPATVPGAPQMRSNGRKGALDGAHGVDPAIAHPNPNPNLTWDQLEVAAASWLAHRSGGETVAETAR